MVYNVTDDDIRHLESLIDKHYRAWDEAEKALAEPDTENRADWQSYLDFNLGRAYGLTDALDYLHEKMYGKGREKAAIDNSSNS